MQIKPLIVYVITFVAFVIGILILINYRSQSIPPSAKPNPYSTEQVTESSASNTSFPERTVGSFLSYTIQAASPNPNPQAVADAVASLSDRLKTQLGTEPTSSDLLNLLAIQDIPDQGYEIANLTYQDHPETLEPKTVAQVEINLKYTQGNQSKTFTLTEYGPIWLIDEIK